MLQAAVLAWAGCLVAAALVLGLVVVGQRVAAAVRALRRRSAGPVLAPAPTGQGSAA